MRAGEESPLVTRPVLVQDLERVLPRIKLRRVQLAQVQELALHGAPTVYPQTLADRIVTVAFAVFVADAAFEEHRSRSIA